MHLFLKTKQLNLKKEGQVYTAWLNACCTVKALVAGDKHPNPNHVVRRADMACCIRNLSWRWWRCWLRPGLFVCLFEHNPKSKTAGITCTRGAWLFKTVLPSALKPPWDTTSPTRVSNLQVDGLVRITRVRKPDTQRILSHLIAPPDST